MARASVPLRRPRGRLWRWLLGVSAGFLGSLLALPAFAAFELNDTTWQGSSALLDLARDALGKERVILAATLSWDRLTPADAILVLHPKSPLSYEQASSFMAAGGRIALLDDFGDGAALLSRFHITRVAAPAAPKDTLGDNANLPIAVPAVASSAGRESGRHPVVLGVDQVMTNHPTALEPESGVELTNVLSIATRDGGSQLFAVVGVIGDSEACGLGTTTRAAPSAHCGRLFAMGDPSALINLMLRYPGNRKLAEQLIRYLVEDDTWGKRGGTLYVLTNRFQQSGSYANAGGLGSAVSEHLANIATWFDEAHEHGLPRWVAFAIALLAAAVTVLWTVNRVARAPARTLPRYAEAPSGTSQAGLPGRAAVLAAPTTHKALAVVELKLALEEQLRQLLGLGPEASTDAILAQVRSSRVLRSGSQRSLESAWTELRKAEFAVMSSSPIQMPTRTVQKLHRTVIELLDEIRAERGAKR